MDIATDSVHNGSEVARQHNLRNPRVVLKEEHIRAEGYHKTWLDEDPKLAYKRLFGEALEKYNKKQKRKDKKIMDYYKKIQNDKKKHPVYEVIVGIYGSNKPRSEIEKILKEFTDNWSERNPHLELIGAYLHDDEDGEMHVHLDYIPWADGYTRGPEKQSALVEAFKQQGIVGTSNSLTAQILWEDKERKFLDELCLEHDIKIVHPIVEGKEKKRKHQEKEEYIHNQKIKEADKTLEEKNSKIENLETDIEKLEEKKLDKEREVAEWDCELEYTKHEKQNISDELDKKEKELSFIESGIAEKQSILNEIKKYLFHPDWLAKTRDDLLKTYYPNIWNKLDTIAKANMWQPKEKNNTFIKEKREDREI